jgi:hypothetical protein
MAEESGVGVRRRGGQEIARLAAAHSGKEEEAQASWPADLALRSSTRRAGDCLHAGTVHMRKLRDGNESDRLRSQRSAGSEAGRVFRASDQARETGLQKV